MGISEEVNDREVSILSMYFFLLSVIYIPCLFLSFFLALYRLVTFYDFFLSFFLSFFPFVLSFFLFFLS